MNRSFANWLSSPESFGGFMPSELHCTSFKASNYKNPQSSDTNLQSQVFFMRCAFTRVGCGLRREISLSVLGLQISMHIEKHHFVLDCLFLWFQNHHCSIKMSFFPPLVPRWPYNTLKSRVVRRIEVTREGSCSRANTDARRSASLLCVCACVIG